ncbi:MAG: hypothetical protein R3B59_09485 [Dehalococcoidia bacterium]
MGTAFVIIEGGALPSESVMCTTVRALAAAALLLSALAAAEGATPVEAKVDATIFARGDLPTPVTLAFEDAYALWALPEPPAEDPDLPDGWPPRLDTPLRPSAEHGLRATEWNRRRLPRQQPVRPVAGYRVWRGAPATLDLLPGRWSGRVPHRRRPASLGPPRRRADYDEAIEAMVYGYAEPDWLSLEIDGREVRFAY